MPLMQEEKFLSNNSNSINTSKSLIWVYDINSQTLVENAPFISKSNCAKTLNINRHTVASYLDKDKILNHKWIFNTIPIDLENLSKWLIKPTVWEALVGDLLGDGHISKPSNTGSSFVPVFKYKNADTDKLQILTDNKNKAGIYLWLHKESDNMYIGSAINLSKRLKDYYSISYISSESRGKSYIYSAILKHGYENFSLIILEHIDITNLSKTESRELVLEREQYYIDNLAPKYNIQLTANRPLGHNHPEDSRIKRSIAYKGENNVW